MNNLKSKNLLNNPLTALKHNSFRNYWITQGISLIGTWMQNISLPWLAFTITKSAFLLSLVGVFQYMPMLIFSIFAGVIIDKLPKKKILIITQLLSMIISFLFFFLLFTNNISYWEILMLAAILGFTNTIDMPTRQSFLIELVGKDDLMNAIALNSMAFNIARILGPAIAGILIASFGIDLCFLFNTLSYLGVIVVLIFIKPKFHLSKNKNNNSNIFSDIKKGLIYILNDNILFLSLFLVFVIGTFAFNFNVLVPVFAKNVLNQQVSGYGFLMSSMGIGSLIGAIAVSFRSKAGPNRFLLVALPIIISISLIITGLTNQYAMSAIFIGITGFFLITFSTTANSTTQINSKHEFRGRVMSIYSLFFAGTTPIGNFFCGVVMKYFGARYGFICCGLVIALFILFFYIFKNNFIKNFLKFEPALADKQA